jgi:hypothetical protein
MVADGKVTAEEAAGLLEALEPAARPEPRPSSFEQPVGPTSRRTLVIQVTEGGHNRVNVRIPLGLARAAGRFIPRQAQDYLDQYEIDLKQLLADLGTNFPEGPLVEVQDEEDHVRIAVE